MARPLKGPPSPASRRARAARPAAPGRSGPASFRERSSRRPAARQGRGPHRIGRCRARAVRRRTRSATLASAVRSGALQPDQAVQQLVDRALSGVGGKLSEAQRLELTAVLREALENDPALRELRKAIRVVLEPEAPGGLSLAAAPRFFAMSRAMRVRRGLVGTVLIALAVGCSRAPRSRARREPLPPPPGPIADAGAWASRMGEVAPAQADARRRYGAARRARRGDERRRPKRPRSGARRAPRLPRQLRRCRRPFATTARVIEAAAGELHVDVSLGRLRARFVGPGWPVDEGTEVRLRVGSARRVPVRRRGRPFARVGQLAAWFEGRERGEAQTQRRRAPRVRVAAQARPTSRRPSRCRASCCARCSRSGAIRSARALGYRCSRRARCRRAFASVRGAAS